MALMKMVDGVEIAMTIEEEAEFLATQPGALPIEVEAYRVAIQAHIDAVAQARSYDSGLACSTYATSTNLVWAAEATTFCAWRDAVWVYAFSELAKVQNGQRPQPSVANLISELPAVAWPE